MVPPSGLSARGEKRSNPLGRTATATSPSDAPATRPPLSATPGGVTRDQWEDPGAAWKSSQKVLFRVERSPIGRITHEPPEVDVALSIGDGAAACAPADEGRADTAKASAPATTVHANPGGRHHEAARDLTNGRLGRSG